MNYDGRRFRSTATETAAGDDVPIGHYHQFGRLVWAEFAGGAVTIGRLVGHTADEATLTASYVQVLTDGRTVSGEVHTTPTVLPDGRLRLCERWRRSDGSEGVSWLEEIADEAAAAAAGPLSLPTATAPPTVLPPMPPTVLPTPRPSEQA